MPRSMPTPSTRCSRKAASSPRRWSSRSTAAATRKAAPDKATREVRTPAGYPEAYAKYVEGGWPALSCDPRTAARACRMWSTRLLRDAQQRQPGLDDVSGPVAWRLRGAARARHARAEGDLSAQAHQRRWTGTMCLTEPHCGTDLGLLRTRPSRRPTAPTRSTARRSSSPPASTTWRRTSCIWCWRALPDAPAGSRASRCSSCRSSMSNADGSLGARNGIFCAGLEHKMGIHATPPRRSVLEDASARWWASPTRACRRCS